MPATATEAEVASGGGANSGAERGARADGKALLDEAQAAKEGEQLGMQATRTTAEEQSQAHEDQVKQQAGDAENEEGGTVTSGDGAALLALGRRLREAQSSLARAMAASPATGNTPGEVHGGAGTAAVSVSGTHAAGDTAVPGAVEAQSQAAALLSEGPSDAVGGDAGAGGTSSAAAAASGSAQLQAITRQRDVLMAALAKLLTNQAATQAANQAAKDPNAA